MTFTVENFAAAGCHIAPEPTEHATIEEAREEVRRRLESPVKGGAGDDENVVELYYDANDPADECGGVVILSA